jgi:hypothetical protein
MVKINRFENIVNREYTRINKHAKLEKRKIDAIVKICVENYSEIFRILKADSEKIIYNNVKDIFERIELYKDGVSAKKSLLEMPEVLLDWVEYKFVNENLFQPVLTEKGQKIFEAYNKIIRKKL